jgi:hypothetical protein
MNYEDPRYTVLSSLLVLLISKNYYFLLVLEYLQHGLLICGYAIIDNISLDSAIFFLLLECLKYEINNTQ